MQQYAQVTLDASNHCTLTYDKFPYPLSNVEGTLNLHDGEWTFKNVTGTNGPGVVRVSGTISTRPGAEPMSVDIGAENIMLVDELRGALPPGMRQLWDALQPHGKVDAQATVRFARLGAKPSVWLQAVPRDDATSIGTSIEPVAFPYRMRLSGGWIEYQDGHAELHGIQASARFDRHPHRRRLRHLARRRLATFAQRSGRRPSASVRRGPRPGRCAARRIAASRGRTETRRSDQSQRRG